MHPFALSSASTWLTVLLAFVIICCTCTSTIEAHKSVPAILAVGDSIIDPGNNNHLKTLIKCNFHPYGRDFRGGQATGRFSNGKIPTDIIAEELGIKKYVPAYLDPKLQAEELLTGVSFASGATGFDPETSKIASVLSLSDQIELFKKYIEKVKGMVGDERTDYILANSLYLIVAGSDDIANTYFDTPFRRKQYDVNSYTDLLVNSASVFLQEIYRLGARKIAVVSAAPIGCVPSQRTIGGGLGRGCAENYNQAAQLLNSKLSLHIDSLNLKLPGIRVVYCDIYNPLLDLIHNPQRYDFDVVDRGCCGTGLIEVTLLCNKFDPICSDESKYIFWDSYHPTEKGYKILISSIMDILKSLF